MSDPFGRAIRDHYRGEREAPLVDRDGERTREHPIERWYFGEFEGDEWLESHLDGPLIDMGAGAGRDALYFQDRFETVAIEVSDRLVATMRDRGVVDARRADMFSLPEQFERDRFRSAYARGTQVQLAGSMAGVERFLSDLAVVTAPDATAVIDGYAPERDATADAFGYREDPAPGLAYRVYHCVYEDEVGETLLFRLFSPDRLRAAAVGTPWTVAEVRYPRSDRPVQWVVRLEKA
ncbi:class I SAM-dependent methyltransferase [Halorussus marinus]|uniref:class I SAM-dependent methyltransferase n=1 Tax=Halorussus marinus TaxID=2505976 RepID=UPI00106EC2EE|nr:class I SAM-dependent methyltransferase [Halorussus marinus]